MNYVFDDNGNLAFREDILTHQNESFQYDALNRLEQVSYEFDGYPQSAGNLYLTYEDGGNISSKSDVADNIEYGDGAAGPHALTSLKNPNPSYQPSDQSISYTNFNKVASISQLDENADPINLTYTYGLDRQRIKTIFTRDAVIEKTKYFIGDYEEVTTSSGTKKYHYISGGTGLCAIFVSDDQDNDTLFYTLNDHLGSLAGVINTETDVVTYYSYDACSVKHGFCEVRTKTDVELIPRGTNREGNPRDNDDWTTKTDADLFADRGFTGHEHLVEFGLIDMNGRVYDPMLGRFLSPDPYVQFAGYADNFNRYSYCLNNPLVYTDPSGESILAALGFAAFYFAWGILENIFENKMDFKESVNNSSFVVNHQQPLHWSADQQSTVPYDNSYGASGIMPMIIQKEETYNSIYDFPLLASLDGEWGAIGDYSYNGDIQKYQDTRINLILSKNPLGEIIEMVRGILIDIDYKQQPVEYYIKKPFFEASGWEYGYNLYKLEELSYNEIRGISLNIFFDPNRTSIARIAIPKTTNVYSISIMHVAVRKGDYYQNHAAIVFQIPKWGTEYLNFYNRLQLYLCGKIDEL